MSNQEINSRIISKIKNMMTDQNVKDFLLEVLEYEASTANLEQSNERPRYTDDYLRLIEHYAEHKKV